MPLNGSLIRDMRGSSETTQIKPDSKTKDEPKHYKIHRYAVSFLDVSSSVAGFLFTIAIKKMLLI